MHNCKFLNFQNFLLKRPTAKSKRKINSRKSKKKFSPLLLIHKNLPRDWVKGINFHICISLSSSSLEGGEKGFRIPRLEGLLVIPKEKQSHFGLVVELLIEPDTSSSPFFLAPPHLLHPCSHHSPYYSGIPSKVQSETRLALIMSAISRPMAEGLLSIQRYGGEKRPFPRMENGRNGRSPLRG